MIDLKTHRWTRRKKTRAQYEALARLNSFLDKNNPRLVRFLIRNWNDQIAAITYRELREAILRGALTVETLQAWSEDYAQFFNKFLKPELLKAVKAGGADTIGALATGQVYDPFITGVENWVNVHGGEWITIIGNESQEAIQGLISYAGSGNVTVDEMSRLIRPLVGLNKPQAKANFDFYFKRREDLIEHLKGTKPNAKLSTIEKEATRRARESAVRYAARQHRQRALMIAETELAFAYNKGAADAVNQFVKEGVLPATMHAQWSTALDEGVCEICSELDGEEVELGESFDFPGRLLYEGSKETPPAHPRCRCALCYIE